MNHELQTVENAGDVMLREIIASPQDKVLRSIYADWLEDNNRTDAVSISRIDGIRKRLIRRYGLEGGLNPHLEGVLDIEYRQGFIEVIKAPFEVLCKNLPQWVTEYPLTEVEVSDKEPWSENEGDPTGDNEFGWWESSQTESGTKGILDQGSGPKVFEAMWNRKVGMQSQDDIGRWILWKTKEEAVKAMSDTLLDMARRGVL